MAKKKKKSFHVIYRKSNNNSPQRRASYKIIIMIICLTKAERTLFLLKILRPGQGCCCPARKDLGGRGRRRKEFIQVVGGGREVSKLVALQFFNVESM